MTPEIDGAVDVGIEGMVPAAAPVPPKSKTTFGKEGSLLTFRAAFKELGSKAASLILLSYKILLIVDLIR